MSVQHTDGLKNALRSAMRRMSAMKASGRAHVPRVIVLAFFSTMLVGTCLLATPLATTGRSATWTEAAFTAVSATAVTGLGVVDTGTFWSPFGQVVILTLIQLGGLGVMTVASLLAIIVARRMRHGTRLIAAQSVGLNTGEVRIVLRRIVRLTLSVELIIGIILATVLALRYDEPLGFAIWSGIFHSVSSLNNAGFSLYSDSLVRFVSDPLICLPLCAAVIMGGMGMPIWVEIGRHLRERHRNQKIYWSLQARLVLTITLGLLIVGTVGTAIAQWNNPATMAELSTPGKLLASFTHSTMSRTAGFNSIDLGAMGDESWLLTDMLMFIGAGSAGTGGGVKVGTVAVLAMVVLAELRGDPDVSVGGYRISQAVQRQAVTVFLMAAAAVATTVFIIEGIDPQFSVSRVAFEAISAFSTTGLSTGITSQLSVPSQWALIVLMFIGRLGPMTLGTSVILRKKHLSIRYPETTVLVG